MSSAEAQRSPHALRLEGGGGYSLRAGDGRDDFGGGAGAGYEYRVLPALGLEARFSGYFFPFDATQYRGEGLATYYAPALGLRLHLAPRAKRLDPWLGAAGTFVRTGPFNRGGLELGLGLDVYLSEQVALGPFIRYGHIFQPNDSSAGGQDGRLLMAGLALTWAPGEPRPSDAEEEAEEADDADDQEQGRPAPGAEAGQAPARADGSTDGAEDPAAGPARPPLAGELDEELEGPPSRRDDARASRVEEAGGEVVLNATLRFDFRSWELRPETEAELREVIRTLRQNRQVRTVIVVGHADRLGDADVNQRISEVRAEAVARFLRRNGARHVRYIVRGVGDSEPLVEGDSPEALAPNRRVELDAVEGRRRP